MGGLTRGGLTRGGLTRGSLTRGGLTRGVLTKGGLTRDVPKKFRNTPQNHGVAVLEQAHVCSKGVGGFPSIRSGKNGKDTKYPQASSQLCTHEASPLCSHIS